ncbi:RAMP superfamily CRISPR-associated protein [Aggregatilineales bacterium SYSU G02658]
MKRIRVTIDLEEPVLANALEGDPNSGVSHNYLPGSLLRGFLISRFMRQQGVETLNLQDEQTRRLFFSDQVRFLNGYIAINNARSVPAPRLLEKLKYGKEKKVFNVGMSADTKNEKGDDTEEKKDALGQFIVFDGKTIRRKAPLKSIRVHIQRSRVGGRPQGDDDGAVYRYEALAPNQTFEAWIVAESDSDAHDLTELMNGSQGVVGFLGGARSAGYGRVRLRGVVDDLPADWSELPIGVLDGRAQIAFASDVILRDARGHYAPTLETLLSCLGVSQANVVKAELRTTTVGGFNRTWGLPLPQTAAIVGGSWLLLQGVDPQALRSRLSSGIGERRNEGFGRFVLNAFTEKEYDYDDKDQADQAPEKAETALSDQGQWLIERLQQNHTERQRLANLPEVSNPPRSSQISKVLGWVHEAKQSKDPSYLTNNFKNMKRTARDQFERARVGDKKLLGWLEETAKSGDYETIQLVLLRAAKQKAKQRKEAAS